jgi:hypothetical protein
MNKAPGIGCTCRHRHPFSGIARRPVVRFERTGLSIKGNPLVLSIVAVACTITVAAAVIWLATEAGVPSETAVPVIVVVLLALRHMGAWPRTGRYQPWR